MSMHDLAVEIKDEAKRVDGQITKAADILKRISYGDDWRDIKGDIDEVVEILESISGDIY